MIGLVNKSVQAFLCDHHGAQAWRDVAEHIGIGADGFEAMLHYDDSLTEALLAAAQALRGSPRETLLEDIGAWLARIEPLRRLLRFGGQDYWDFLFSLENLQDRCLLALPDLEMPELTLQTELHGRFTVIVRGAMPGWGAVMAGIMRAMADDYGALVLIEPLAPLGECERVQVALLDAAYARGRQFELAQPLSRVTV